MQSKIDFYDRYKMITCDVHVGLLQIILISEDIHDNVSDTMNGYLSTEEDLGKTKKHKET